MAETSLDKKNQISESNNVETIAASTLQTIDQMVREFIIARKGVLLASERVADGAVPESSSDKDCSKSGKHKKKKKKKKHKSHKKDEGSKHRHRHHHHHRQKSGGSEHSESNINDDNDKNCKRSSEDDVMPVAVSDTVSASPCLSTLPVGDCGNNTTESTTVSLAEKSVQEGSEADAVKSTENTTDGVCHSKHQNRKEERVRHSHDRDGMKDVSKNCEQEMKTWDHNKESRKRNRDRSHDDQNIDKTPRRGTRHHSREPHNSSSSIPEVHEHLKLTPEKFGDLCKDFDDKRVKRSRSKSRRREQHDGKTESGSSLKTSRTSSEHASSPIRKQRRDGKRSTQSSVIQLSDDDPEVMSDEMIEKLHKRLTASLQKGKERQIHAGKEASMKLSAWSTVNVITVDDEDKPQQQDSIVIELSPERNVENDVMAGTIPMPDACSMSSAGSPQPQPVLPSVPVPPVPHLSPVQPLPDVGPQLPAQPQQEPTAAPASKPVMLPVLGKKPVLKFGLKITETSAQLISLGIKSEGDNKEKNTGQISNANFDTIQQTSQSVGDASSKISSERLPPVNNNTLNACCESGDIKPLSTLPMIADDKKAENCKQLDDILSYKKSALRTDRNTDEIGSDVVSGIATEKNELEKASVLTTGKPEGNANEGEDKTHEEKTSNWQKTENKSERSKSRTPTSPHCKSPHSKSSRRSHSREPRSRRSVSKLRETKSHRSRSREKRSRRSRSRDTKSRRSRSRDDKARRSRSRDVRSRRSRSRDTKSRRSRSREARLRRSPSRDTMSRRSRSREAKSRDVRSHRSRSRDRDQRSHNWRRQRSRSRDKQFRSRDRSHRSRSKSRHSRSRSRSPLLILKKKKSPPSTPQLNFDKDKLREIAMKNAHANMLFGYIPVPSLRPAEVAVIKSGGKSVKELTDFCKKIAAEPAKQVADNLPEADKVTSNETKPITADEDTNMFINTTLKALSTSNIILNIRNAKQLPIMTPQEKAAQSSVLRTQFPVSSGTDHRTKESEWVPVDKDDSNQAAAAVVDDDKVYNEQPSNPEELESIVGERVNALRKLKNNPHDKEALGTIFKVQQQMKQWAEVSQLPGQFTGSTGIQTLTPQELANEDPRRQAWVRKDVFTKAAPVTGGIGRLLLQRMGWKVGTGLGKNNEGITAPIALDIKTDRRGLTSFGEKLAPPLQSFGRNTSRLAHIDMTNKHPVSALNELCSKNRWDPPHFDELEEIGPTHGRMFRFKITLNGREFLPTVGSPNKKTAKMEAAQLCLQELGLLPRTIVGTAT